MSLRIFILCLIALYFGALNLKKYDVRKLREIEVKHLERMTEIERTNYFHMNR